MFNNETGQYEDVPWIREGLWLEQDTDSELFDENMGYRFVITDESGGKGISENEGPDHVKYVAGPYAGRYVLDVLNEVCRGHDRTVNPYQWEDEEFWNRLGFLIVHDVLKRFNPVDGYYHA